VPVGFSVSVPGPTGALSFLPSLIENLSNFDGGRVNRYEPDTGVAEPSVLTASRDTQQPPLYAVT